MRLTILFVVAAIFNVSARGVSQNVTISGKSVALESVLSQVEKQTGYVFLYPENILKSARPVTIQAKDKPLLQFLEELFARQPFRYSIESKTINIAAAATPAAPAKKNIEPQAGLFVPPPPISGVVTDSAGKPIAGVTISVAASGRGSYSATSTDARGHFEILANRGEKLTFSIVGYEPQTVTVGGQMQLNVVLKVKVSELDELVITSVNTGYQRIRPEQSTGAVSQISTKEYESRISTNFIDGLVNRLPGLMINNNVQFTSTGPDGVSSSNNLFNIRGISTMSANQSPLIVIDGYPTELTIDMIDPNEIKSVTILKDAAAATVYGVRASNGVIVIERKQASQGRPKFTFRTTLGFTPKENYSRYRWDDSASSIVTNYQKDRLVVDANLWEQVANATGGTIQRSKVAYILAQTKANIITAEQAAQAYADLAAYDNTKDYGRLFLQTALTQTYNLNVSGGGGSALYYITANYTKNRLNEIKNDNNRLQLSVRSTLKLAQRLSLELTTDYQEQRRNSSPTPGISSIAPYERFQDENGNPASIVNNGISPYYNDVLISRGLYDQLYYPLIDVNEINTKVRTYNNRVTANFNYNIGAGFNLSFGGIYESSRTDNSYLASEQSSFARRYVNAYVTLDTTTKTLKYNVPRGGYLNQQTSSTSSYTGRAQLNYNKKLWNNHSINGIIGAEIRNVINKGNVATYFGYNDGTLLQMPADLASISNGAISGLFSLGSPLRSSNVPFTNLFNQIYTEDRFLSGYANLVYAYKNTYSVTGSIRIDQSNLFGTNPKYKYKPLWSVGAAWNINKEQFMQDLDWVKMLKLRLAYGFNGNVAKMSLPQVIAQASINNFTSPSTTALSKFSYANSSLRWEQTNNFNLGLDYHLFKNITGTVDYYQKKSTDLLSNAQIDPTIGASPSLINAATIKNQGIELALHADWISTKKLNWNTGLVVARNTSMVLDVYRTGTFNPETANLFGFIKDYPVGALFAYNYGGLDNTGFPTLYNDRGHVYTTTVTNTTNPVYQATRRTDTSGLARYMGPSIPTINGGLSNRIDVGNFYFFCMVNYYGGFKVRVPRPNPSSTRPLKGAGNYWKAPGDENVTDVMNLIGFGPGNAANPYNYADTYVVNADYITLGDVTVSYNLSNMNFIKKAGFTNCEFKFQASNLWTVGLNDYNFSMATGSYQKSYVTPTYTIGLFTNF